MSFKSHLIKAAGLGVLAVGLTAGAAFAATATTSVNVRSGPGTSFGVIDTLSAGDRVSITGQSGNWCSVTRPGPNGWVNCSFLAGGRVNVYDGPRYRDYGRFDPGPSVSFSFGFGSPRFHPRPMRPWWW